MSEDDPIGRNRATTRYETLSREMLDLQRDVAHEWFGPELGEKVFAYHCLATAMKYEGRAGAKVGEAEEKELGKADFYRQLCLHVLGDDVADPRVSRESFLTYERGQLYLSPLRNRNWWAFAKAFYGTVSRTLEDAAARVLCPECGCRPHRFGCSRREGRQVVLPATQTPDGKLAVKIPGGDE